MENSSLYTKVEAASMSPKGMNEKIIRSIKLYLSEYQNTSLTKKYRLESLEKCAEILEYVVTFLNPALPQEEQDLLFAGFTKILQKVKMAVIDTNTLYSFKDEIGFLSILA